LDILDFIIVKIYGDVYVIYLLKENHILIFFYSYDVTCTIILLLTIKNVLSYCILITHLSNHQLLTKKLTTELIINIYFNEIKKIIAIIKMK